MSDLRDTIGGLSPAEEVKAMFRDWRVMVAAILCGTIVILGLLGVVGLLAYNGRSTEAVMVILTAVIVPILTAVLSGVSTIKHNTNGTNSRLLDAAVGPARQATPEPPAEQLR